MFLQTTGTITMMPRDESRRGMKKSKTTKRRMTQVTNRVLCKEQILSAIAVARKATSHQNVPTRTRFLKKNGTKVWHIRIT